MDTIEKIPALGKTQETLLYEVQGTRYKVLSRLRTKKREPRNETLFVATRDSYDSRISTSSFFNRRSALDISLDLVLRIS